MISKFLKLKKNKLLFSLVIVCFAVALVDVFMIVFNIVQVVAMNKNAANMAGLFLPINIIAICLNAICIMLIVAYLIYRKVKKL